ncbi:hypothetical protein [Humibacter albus]|jgi:hypothetical protein|uniref:hypothetical protein n=1 Tax=Humibacter albus TaxID=427754 RepID=UPI0003B705FB|nr:hypothetical protein [Humibacter albus]
MFGRRRHAAPAVAPIVSVAPAETPRPRLADEQIFELVHTRIAAAIGEGGEWVVRRRRPDDTDDLFRTVLAHQVAADVTDALRSAQLQLEAGQTITVETRTGAIPIVTGGQASGDGSDTAVADAASTVVAEDDSEFDEAPVVAAAGADEPDDGHGPAHRHDEPDVDDEAVLDEEAVALQWEPAPITVWTDLKRPVTGEVARAHFERELVR